MLGLELTSETMLCLGIMFILSGVLFFYMKKQITHIEDAQMEQAKLLQHIIANISANPPTRMNGGTMANNEIDVRDQDMNNLIDVSDGEEDSDNENDSEDEYESENDDGEEDSDEESDEESDNDSDDETNIPVNTSIDKDTFREFTTLPIQEACINDIDEDSIVEIPNGVKVVNMNSESAPVNEPEEVELEVESLTSTNLDDDDDDDTLTINSSVSGANLAKTSLKALKVGDLRKMVIERGLHSDPSKVKKAELITLLQQH